MAATDVGTGTTITFQSGFFAEIADINPGGAEIPVIDAAYMGQGTTKKKIFGRSQDIQSVVVDVNLNADKDLTALLNATTETITITMPIPAGGTVGAKWAFTGKAMKWSAKIPVEDKMQATIELQPTSAITFTASV